MLQDKQRDLSNGTPAELTQLMQGFQQLRPPATAAAVEEEEKHCSVNHGGMKLDVDPHKVDTEQLQVVGML